MLHSQHDKAEEHARLGIINDPLSYYAHFMLSGTLGIMGAYDEAILEGELGLKLDPEAIVAHWMLSGVYCWAGKFRKSETTCLDAIAKFGKNSWLQMRLLLIYISEKRDVDAKKVFQDLCQLKNEQFVQPMILAIYTAAMGETIQAIEFASEAADIYDPSFTFLGGCLPDSEALRALPEFLEMMRQFNIKVDSESLSLDT